MENTAPNTNNFLNWVEIKNFKSIKDLRTQTLQAGECLYRQAKRWEVEYSGGVGVVGGNRGQC